MYEIFEKLLKTRNVTAYQVGKATGISTSTLSEWKNGKYTPKMDKLIKIADYFDVTVDFLLYGSTERLSDKIADAEIRRYEQMKKSPDSELSEDEEMMEYLEALKNNPGMRTLFSKTKNATKEDLEKVIRMIDILKGNTDGGYYY